MRLRLGPQRNAFYDPYTGINLRRPDKMEQDIREDQKYNMANIRYGLKTKAIVQIGEAKKIKEKKEKQEIIKERAPEVTEEVEDILEDEDFEEDLPRCVVEGCSNPVMEDAPYCDEHRCRKITQKGLRCKKLATEDGYCSLPSHRPDSAGESDE